MGSSSRIFNPNAVQTRLQSHLNLKFKHARALIDKVNRENNNELDRDDDIIFQECVRMYNEMSFEDQQNMQASCFSAGGSSHGSCLSLCSASNSSLHLHSSVTAIPVPSNEPEWKRKARLNAQRREEAWLEKHGLPPEQTLSSHGSTSSGTVAVAVNVPTQVAATKTSEDQVSLDSKKGMYDIQVSPIPIPSNEPEWKTKARLNAQKRKDQENMQSTSLTAGGSSHGSVVSVCSESNSSLHSTVSPVPDTGNEPEWRRKARLNAQKEQTLSFGTQHSVPVVFAPTQVAAITTNENRTTLDSTTGMYDIQVSPMSIPTNEPEWKRKARLNAQKRKDQQNMQSSCLTAGGSSHRSVVSVCSASNSSLHSTVSAVPDPGDEPEWKRKARLNAQKREAAWLEKHGSPPEEMLSSRSLHSTFSGSRPISVTSQDTRKSDTDKTTYDPTGDETKVKSGPDDIVSTSTPPHVQQTTNAVVESYQPKSNRLVASSSSNEKNYLPEKKDISKITTSVVVGDKPEPEWRRKARLNAEKSEASWKKQQQQTHEEQNHDENEQAETKSAPEMYQHSMSDMTTASIQSLNLISPSMTQNEQDRTTTPPTTTTPTKSTQNSSCADFSITLDCTTVDDLEISKMDDTLFDHEEQIIQSSTSSSSSSSLTTPETITITVGTTDDSDSSDDDDIRLFPKTPKEKETKRKKKNKFMKGIKSLTKKLNGSCALK